MIPRRLIFMEMYGNWEIVLVSANTAAHTAVYAYQHREEPSHDVRRNSEELLLDSRFAWVDRPDNGRRKEGDTLNGDVVEEENQTDDESRRCQNSLLDSARVHLVQDCGGSSVLGLDSGRGKILFFLGQPSCDFWTISHQHVRADADDCGDDAFDQEDLLPSVDFANAVDFEDTTGQ